MPNIDDGQAGLVAFDDFAPQCREIPSQAKSPPRPVRGIFSKVSNGPGASRTAGADEWSPGEMGGFILHACVGRAASLGSCMVQLVSAALQPHRAV